MLSDAQIGFFSGFLDFTVNKKASAADEFDRLCRQRQWKKGSKTQTKYENAFRKLESVNVTTGDEAPQNGVDSAERRSVQPKSQRRTAAELTPDWILADVLKELNLGPKPQPDVVQISAKEPYEESEETDEGVLIGYFDKFPDFDAQKAAPIQNEFSRLANQQGWKYKSERYQNELKLCLEQEVTSLFGPGTSTLTPLAHLCEDLGADPLPFSNTQCKKFISKQGYINIFDYVNAKRACHPVPTFKSKRKFLKYTKGDLRFPKDIAKSHRILTALLEFSLG